MRGREREGEGEERERKRESDKYTERIERERKISLDRDI